MLNIPDFHHFWFLHFTKQCDYIVKVWWGKWQIFYCKFLAEYNCDRILKNDQHLAKLWAKKISLVFFWLTVYTCPVIHNHTLGVRLCRIRCITERGQVLIPHTERYLPANNSGNTGHCASSTFDFICDVGRQLSAASGDIRDTAFLFQRLAVTIQRFNSALLLESLSDLAGHS